jgi:four helix bundle protein
MLDSKRKPIRSFEDMDVWRQSRALVRKIFDLTRRASFKQDRWLKYQMRAAAGSLMSNVAEGFERNGNKEFVQFLIIAKGSAGELRSQLYIAADQQFLGPRDFEVLKSECVCISRSLSGLIRYLNASKMKGVRFKSQPTG